MIALNSSKLKNYGIEIQNWKFRNVNIGFLEMVGKVKGGWPIAKTIKNMIPITLAVLLVNPLRMTPGYDFPRACIGS